MSNDNVLLRIARALEQAGIPFMLTGSFASSVHGAPRSTQDIDIVIDPQPEQLNALVVQLNTPEYYVDRNAASDALESRSMFNIIDYTSGWKIDLIIRKSRPFSLAEFDRRQIVDFQGVRLPIATVEDVVIAKLEWAKLGQSERQIPDAAGMLKARAGQIDTKYVEQWVRELDLKDQWDAARRIAGPSL